ncbi:MAG: hypothetical protein AB1778_08605, partial [Candidatus Bipolaricaulota bacterium]
MRGRITGPDDRPLGHAAVRAIALSIIASTLLWTTGCMLEPGSHPWGSVSYEEAAESQTAMTHAMAAAMRGAAPFCTPTAGSLGYRHNEGTHAGIDIWTGNYPSNAAAPGNAIYLVYGGTLTDIWEGRNRKGDSAAGSDGVPQTLIFTHSIDTAYAAVVPALQVATVYMHLADETTGISYINSALKKGNWYPAGTFLGYQGNRRYYRSGSSESVITHLHFDVRLLDLSTYVDPSLYLGLAVNANANPLPKGTRIAQTCTSAASIRLTSPNGGEIWQAGSTQTIAWTSTGGGQKGSIFIFCSPDGGASWDPVAGPLDLGASSYSWVVPDIPTSASLVFAGKWLDGAWAASDWSDREFSIVSPCVYSVSPTNKTIAYSGGSDSVSVTTSPTSGCAWTATSNVGWI